MSPLPKGMEARLGRERSAHIGFFPRTVLSCWSGQETASGPTSPASVLPCFAGMDTQMKGVYFAASKKGKHLFLARDPVQIKTDVIILILGTFPKDKKKKKKNQVCSRRTARRVVVVLLFSIVLKI